MYAEANLTLGMESRQGVAIKADDKSVIASQWIFLLTHDFSNERSRILLTTTNRRSKVRRILAREHP